MVMIFSLTLTPDEMILQYDETFFRLSAPVFAGMAGGGGGVRSKGSVLL